MKGEPRGPMKLHEELLATELPVRAAVWVYARRLAVFAAVVGINIGVLFAALLVVEYPTQTAIGLLAAIAAVIGLTAVEFLLRQRENTTLLLASAMPISLARWLIIGIVGAIVLGGIYFGVSGRDSNASPCERTGTVISYPVSDQIFDGMAGGTSVSVIGSFECVPGGESLWVTVDPPRGSPIGVHETQLDFGGKTLTSNAVLSSGLGRYRICFVTADPAGDLALREVVAQNPPTGIRLLPPGVRRERCTEVELR